MGVRGNVSLSSGTSQPLQLHIVCCIPLESLNVLPQIQSILVPRVSFYVGTSKFCQLLIILVIRLVQLLWHFFMTKILLKPGVIQALFSGLPRIALILEQFQHGRRDVAGTRIRG